MIGDSAGGISTFVLHKFLQLKRVRKRQSPFFLCRVFSYFLLLLLNLVLFNFQALLALAPTVVMLADRFAAFPAHALAMLVGQMLDAKYFLHWFRMRPCSRISRASSLALHEHLRPIPPLQTYSD